MPSRPEATQPRKMRPDALCGAKEPTPYPMTACPICGFLHLGSACGYCQPQEVNHRECENRYGRRADRGGHALPGGPVIVGAVGRRKP